MARLDIGLVAHDAVEGHGEGRVAVELARTLASRGHEVTVHARSLTAELIDAVTFRRLATVPGPAMFADLVLLASATRSIRRGRHDVVCVMGTAAVPPSPFVYYAHFSHVGWRSSWAELGTGRPRAYHRVDSRIGLSLERYVSTRAARVVAVSHDVVDELGVDPGRATVVPNGVDPDRFHPVDPARKEEVRRRLALPSGAFVVAFIGEHKTPRKGLAQLIAAIAAGPSSEHLLVAGRGDEDRAKRLAASGGAAGRVHLLGVADPTDVFAAADVVAVPSVYEPFSLVALEAAAAGLPVLLSRAVGAGQYLGAAAEFVERPEPASIRAALDVLRADPARRARLGAAGREVACSLRWDLVASKAADVVEMTAGPTVGRQRHRGVRPGTGGAPDVVDPGVR